MLKLSPAAKFLLACLLILTQGIVPASAASATDTITGTLVGEVVDNTGAPMAGVRIIVLNQDTGNQRATITNAEGRYQFAFLPLGIYTINASKDGFVVTQPTNQPVKTALNKVINTAPRIVMSPVTVAPAAPTPAPAPAPAPSPAATQDEVGQLANSVDATRRGNADERQVSLLPLAGVRTFDDLAFLAAGVAPPPQVKGVAGPGIGAGIGTAGQFSVNGQRARANNFTVDGSDNNDEDVGVRRQGFVSLVPQSIESIKEFQIVTQLWDAELGRNLGSQVNAVSRSGTNQVHGTFYDFFNHSALNARNFFDYTSDRAQQFALTAVARFADGTTQTVPVRIRTSPTDPGTPVVQRNPSEDKDRFQRNQGGASIGFPILRDRTFFFGSFERQDIKARQETHFSVPTVAQRGFLGFGATGFLATDRNGNQQIFFPTFIAGDSVFSLFPFPNNPVGPYGENTFTQVLPADAEGTIFSLKLDHNFKLFGPNVAHTFTARYNFTNDERQVPAVGGAIFSGLKPLVGTQNLSLFLNSQLAPQVANQLRGSYGRTRLRFDEQRNPLAQAPQFVPNEQFLVNRQRLVNLSFPTTDPGFLALYQPSSFSAESNLGPIGQLIVHPFSPVGVDVFLFPQARTNNTFQFADTVTYFRGNHTFKFGADLRRTQLNSFLNRNFRPQVVFGGTVDLTGNFPQVPIPNLSRFGPTPGFFSGSDLAALGIPTGIFQSLAIGEPDTTVGLRLWQYNFFINDNWRVRRGLTLDYGLRYEYNTVPTEVNRRIENTFRLDGLPAVDPSLRIAAPFTNGRVIFNTQQLTDSFNATLNALRGVLAGRTEIYDPDRNNFGPHFGFAWDPLAASSTQAGKTAVRGGFGVYYDINLGSVVSQSRNVFPTFVPFNVDANTFAYANQQFFQSESGFLAIFNPIFVPLDIVGSSQSPTRFPLIRDGRLNVIGAPSGALQPLLGLLFNPAGAGVGLLPSGGGLAFTLPERKLRAPYAFHFNLQIERELFKDYLANVAYVGSRGQRLTRFRTPNGGPNSPTFPFDPLGLTIGGANLPPALALPPLGNLATQPSTRPIAALGAYTIFDSSAASNYQALQVSVTKRFSGGRQVTAAYTWSHAIDDVSDVFDVAGAFTLPQDDRNLRAERGQANFDVRHRFVWSSLSNVPFISRFNNAGGAKELLLGGWQMASISSYQTGQPFTVNTSFDVNLDGNLTDRLNTTSGLTVDDRGPQKIALTVPFTSLLAPLTENGRVGRNTFRARGIAKTDFTLIKNFRVGENNSLVLRIEAFNIWNRTHFGIPVRILEAPSFGRAVDTAVNPRQVQFALKYVF
jgi:hypothetical protein